MFINEKIRDLAIEIEKDIDGYLKRIDDIVRFNQEKV